MEAAGDFCRSESLLRLRETRNLLQVSMHNQINTDTLTVHGATPQFLIGPGGGHEPGRAGVCRERCQTRRRGGFVHVRSSCVGRFSRSVHPFIEYVRNASSACNGRGGTTADSVDDAIQQVVGSGGQQVIAGGANRPMIVTVPDGQRVLTAPATNVAEETVIGDGPPAERRRIEIVESRAEPPETEGTEALQKQLEEAHREAQRYRRELLKKEQEAETYRLKLEAIARQQGSKKAA